MQGGQQQAAAQQPQAQMGNPDLQKDLMDQLQGMLHCFQSSSHSIDKCLAQQLTSLQPDAALEVLP